MAQQANVLITGGAGFIGSHLADELMRHGYRVRALDSLSPQVHNSTSSRPSYLSSEVELMQGDLRSPDAVERALKGIDAVYHFAAAVGVGQSMYEIEKYMNINALGTAVLLEALTKKNIHRLIVASSMSIYGEGLYRAPDGSRCTPADRPVEQLKSGRWEIFDSAGQCLEPIATTEDARPSLTSVYALSKYAQERMCLMVGRAYKIPTVGLRFFNVYGPRQALSNPYTGVLAIFASRLLNDHPPMLYEDGLQRRDFVSVHDVVRACQRALSAEAATGRVVNVGSGRAHTVREIAQRVADVMGKEQLAPEITGKYRVGDIRHCYADITKARSV